MKNLTKVLLLIVSGLTLAALPLLSACSSQPEEKKGERPKSISIPAAPVGTGGYITAVALAALITKHMGIPASSPASASAIQGAAMIKRGEANMLGQSSADAYWAFRGLKDWGQADVGRAPVRLFIVTGLQRCNYFARNDSRINRLEDVKGHTFASNVVSVSQKDAYLVTLEAVGLAEKDVKLVECKSVSGDLIPNVQTGVADIGMNISTQPAAEMQQLLETSPVHLLGMTEAQVKSVVDKYPYYHREVHPAGSYKGVDKDLTVFGAYFCQNIYGDLFSEDFAYELTKMFWTNVDEYRKASPALNVCTIDNVLAGFRAKWAPLHPGTIKYFKEKGVWMKDDDKIQQELMDLEKQLAAGKK